MPEQRLIEAVGPGMPNRANDVRLVQRLLDRNAALTGSHVNPTGTWDSATAAAVVNFQRRVLRSSFPTGIVKPEDETFWRLSETSPRRMLAGALGGIVLAPFVGEDRPSEDDYQQAAKRLNCEVRAIKAVTAIESPKGPYDKMGRPTILFERHYFSRLTLRRYDGRYPAISNPVAGGYSFPEPDQYVRLQHAYALNADAALKSASWGAFQIMGANFAAAGYGTVGQFVRAMCQSVGQQLDAFVSFIHSNPTLLHAIQQKNWAAFANSYNGPSYRKNLYDTKLAAAYSHATD
ncbi:N-acetylmuramidase family protein [Terriglobus aquaticus]|uniref:N-acetylmuramidase domain-containing protein n=1 Tax=Terriglobus aquaticus TaxID=940139 RepID=A0ABW9KMH0_9BACT|nr:N-acetylmuramidase family protein [Terriglobus aquaticus]